MTDTEQTWPYSVAQNTIWDKNRKYMRRQMLQNTSGPHDESPHGGGRRPHHIMWPASLLQHLRPHVFSVFAPYCISFFGPILYCIPGPEGTLNPCCFSFPVKVATITCESVVTHTNPVPLPAVLQVS